jgi:hypothetical protein
MGNHPGIETELGGLLARIEATGSAEVSDQELSGWPTEVSDLLVQTGLLPQATNATSVACPGCEEACAVRPYTQTDFRGKTHLLHICEKRDDVAMVEIPPSALRRWRQDLAGLVDVVRKSLPMSGAATLVEADRLWYVGRVVIRSKAVEVFLGRHLNAEDASLVRARVSPGVDPFVLSVSIDRGWDWPLGASIAYAALGDVLEVRGSKTAIARTSLERALLAARRSDGVVPFPTPKGATWEKLIIRFVDDETVEVKLLDVSRRLSYTEMGMSDKRTGLPDTAWKRLRELAESRGTLGGRREEHDPLLKSHVRTLQRALREVFAIPGDPMKPYSRAGRCWRSNFVVSPTMR